MKRPETIAREAQFKRNREARLAEAAKRKKVEALANEGDGRINENVRAVAQATLKKMDAQAAKPKPGEPPPLPRTVAEWLVLKERATAERKAQRARRIARTVDWYKSTMEPAPGKPKP